MLIFAWLKGSTAEPSTRRHTASLPWLTPTAERWHADQIGYSNDQHGHSVLSLSYCQAFCNLCQ